MTRTQWRLMFGGVTAVAVLAELVASFDGNPRTEPWTEWIVTYVPWEVTAAAVGALTLWLPVHFGWRYWRRRQATDPAPGPVTTVEVLPELRYDTTRIGDRITVTVTDPATGLVGSSTGTVESEVRRRAVRNLLGRDDPSSST